MDAESIDAIVSDPPYGLSFMGKGWDHGVPGEGFWIEALRVAKPGAHLLAFGGTRTFHRLAVAIEDAGWEIRDCLMWVYGSGFPKSLDVSKAIDKAAGAEREVVGVRQLTGYGKANAVNGQQARNTTEFVQTSDVPASEAAKAWHGRGTALKPAYEPIIMARKPLTGTVAANVLKHGTGAINVDGCRVGSDRRMNLSSGTPGAGRSRVCNQVDRGDGKTADGRDLANLIAYGQRSKQREPQEVTGRWPANVLHDGSDEVTGLMPTTTSGGTPFSRPSGMGYHGAAGQDDVAGNRGDSGSAARFFYCAKASKADRDKGCDGLDAHKQDETRNEGDPGGDNPRNRGAGERSNHHPTVKPTDLMRYLCRLVTPSGGTVLDPFMGSGSTGKAATLEGFRFVGCELQPEYMAIAEARIGHAEGEVEPLLRVRS
jgi:site-specific DNA-methyltransferase (adenine-specific)